MQYAHRNLVVHRDLKPGNILVTGPGSSDPGVPKLLDFGIAKLLTADSGVPATTVRALTPEYASPEQVLGRSITTATDVYSLGVLLFVILAERLPYRASATETAALLRAICEEEPAWDSGGLGLIEGDLQNIIAQSLRKEPERRYLSVEQFADDIRRYLAGLPVSARPDTLFYRARKFVVRRAIPLAATVVMAAAILAGLAGSLWQARRAEQQRLIAQRRFEEARRLAHTVIHDIQPKLAAIDGTVTLRKTLIEETLVYLEALSRDAADSPALMRELLDSYAALAEVAADVGMANVGDYKGAVEILQRAETLAGTLLRIDPSNSASVRSLVQFYRVASRYHVNYGSAETGQRYARRGLEMAERLAAASPEDGSAREEVAKAALTLANATGDATADTPEDSNRRLGLFERALAIWRDLLKHQPPNADEMRRNIGLVDKSISGIWSEIGNYPRALEYAAEAREIDRQFLARYPSSPDAQMDLAFDIGSIGWTYYLMKDYPKAAETMRENVALRGRVAAADPNDRRAADRLAYALRDLARTEAILGDRAAAIRDYLRSVDLYIRILQTAPLNLQSLFRFAESAYDLGEIDRKQGAPGNGCRWFRKSLELLDEYERKTSISPPVAAEIAEMRRAAVACRQ